MSVIISRCQHTARTIAQMIAINGFNAINGYRISDRVSKGDQIYLGPRSNDHPSMIIISNDNPWLPLIPVTIRGIDFTFHPNWYIKISELTSPYNFALANHNRLLETKLMNGYTYSNREMIISFK